MLLREEKSGGIDIACFDEPAGLPAPPAGIGAVHEAALVVHEAVQAAARASQSLPEIGATDLLQFGPDRVSHREDLSEDVDQALLAIEAEQHAHGPR